MTTSEYTDAVREHFANPRNPGKLADATGSGQAGEGTGGDLMIQIGIRAPEGVVEEARFRAFGCSATIASASVTTELLKGRSLQQVLALGAEEVDAALGGLPACKRHCAAYAAEAAHAAARDTLEHLPASG